MVKWNPSRKGRLLVKDFQMLYCRSIVDLQRTAFWSHSVLYSHHGSTVLTTLYRLTGGTVAEMLRGIRMYFHKLVSVLTAPAAAQAQLGLGHSYSRAKVKFNVHRSDNMIIQSISLLDQLDKDINTFSMRIR